MSTSGNQGGICAAALRMRGTAAAGSLSASGRGGAQGCSPCWLRTEWCVLFTSDNNRKASNNTRICNPLYTVHYFNLWLIVLLFSEQVCSAHKTLESTTNYYISENVSAKQCNCHLEITKKKSHSETKMSAIFQNWVSVYSSLNYISTHNHAVVMLNKNTQMGCWGIRV